MSLVVYNRLMKSWFQDNDIGNYSTFNEEKSVVNRKFVRTLMNKIYKYLILKSKNVYIDKIADMLNEYNRIW